MNILPLDPSIVSIRVFDKLMEIPENLGTPIEMNRDLPFIQPSIGASVKRKKTILKKQIRTIKKDGNSTNAREEFAPLPPLPPLAPIVPNPGDTKNTSIIKEERNIKVEGGSDNPTNNEDPFIEALLERGNQNAARKRNQTICRKGRSSLYQRFRNRNKQKKR